MMTKRRRVLAAAAVIVSAGLLALAGWGYADRGVGMGLREHAREVLARHDAGPGGPSDADVFMAAMEVESVTTTRTSTRLTVTFVGAQGPGSEPCGRDYDAEAIESANAVVVIVAGRPRDLLERFNISLGTTELCNAVGYERTATVTLTRPLGERAVLDAQSGRPVRVTTEP